MRSVWLGTLLTLAAACGGGPADQTDAGGADAARREPDAARPPDAVAPDALALPLAGFGSLSGACDVLDDELTASTPAIFRGAIDFDRAYSDADLTMLSAGGQEIIADDNAGGSSLYSEVFAYEVLYRCELAVLLKTETEIVYDTTGKITDFLARIDGLQIGVSVVRAVAFPFEDPYTVTQARTMLEGKLADILESSANVSAADRWQKQILAVLAYAPAHADSVQIALGEIDPSLTADTIVWITVTNGVDDFIYSG